jgi:spore coat protein U-like protein
MYSSSFNGANAMLSFNANEGLLASQPSSCGTTSKGSFPFTVSANVQQTCTVSAGTLDFGNVAGFLTANRDAQSTVSVKCLSGTAYKVGLDNGQHGTRRMAGPGGFINYELYRNSGRSQRWGNTPGTDTYDASGNGNTQNLVVYGRVPPQSTPAAGTYTDTVTVTVTY